MVTVVVEGDVRARRDTTGEVLQTLEQIRLGLDEGCFGDEALGLGDGVGQRLGVHPGNRLSLSSAVQYWTELVDFPP